MANFDGGPGDDTFVGDGTDEVINGNGGNDTLSGGAGNDTINGGDGDDTIDGGDGNDTLTGGIGLDIVHGGAGFDIIKVTAADIVAGELYDGGADGGRMDFGGPTQVDITGVTLTSITDARAGQVKLTKAQLAGFTGGIEGISFTLADGGAVTVNAVMNPLVTTTFNLAPVDTVFTVARNQPGARDGAMRVNGNTGNDTINGTGLADRLYGNDGNDALYGGGGNDDLYGGAGDDILDGGSGNNNMYGGVGDDTYYYRGISDHISENPGEGYDTEISSIGLALEDNIERGILTGTGGAQLFGNAGDNWLIGNSGANDLFGLGANDRLDGAGGADHLSGGVGDDTYVYDPLDTITENANEGSDTIEASASYALNVANVENVTLTGTANIDATGDAGANVLVGNTGNNVLNGGAGNDTLVGYGGADTLNGGADNDTLVVSTGGDGTVIDGGAGTDTLVVTGAVTLGGLAGIEAIDLQSGGAMTITGAQFNTGLAPNATLGGTGSLTINMAAGDSELYLQQLLGGTSVTIIVNGAADGEVIKGAVSAVNIINGGDGSDWIRGSLQGDTLNGGNGGDKIEGGMGADLLTGGAGADVFRYQSASASGLGVNADHVTDFAIGTDHLGFTLIDADAVAPGDQPFSFIGTAAFANTGVGQIHYLNSGADLLVQVDADGNGVADMDIVLNGLVGQTLTANDFLL
jgi:Ca2+-binding RTX toxin-like protein